MHIQNKNDKKESPLIEPVNQGGRAIAPGEVEAVLMEHEAVRQVVVFGVPHKRLGEVVAAAIIFKPGKRASESQLKTFALERLDSFKVPCQVVFVYEIPKAPTGEIQRSLLHERFSQLLMPGYVPPESESEFRITVAWSELLGIEQVGRFDNFYIKGGDSLLAEQALAKINGRMGSKVTPMQFFLNPTPSELGYVIDKTRPKADTKEFNELLSEIESLSEDDLLKHLDT
jgi:hypothetical protein